MCYSYYYSHFSQTFCGDRAYRRRARITVNKTQELTDITITSHNGRMPQRPRTYTVWTQRIFKTFIYYICKYLFTNRIVNLWNSLQMKLLLFSHYRHSNIRSTIWICRSFVVILAYMVLYLYLYNLYRRCVLLFHCQNQEKICNTKDPTTLWNNFKNLLIFGKVKAYKNCAILDHPVYCVSTAKSVLHLPHFSVLNKPRLLMMTEAI